MTTSMRTTTISSKRISKIVNNSIQRLTRKKDYFSQFENFEDWVCSESDQIVDDECRYIAHIKQHIIKKYQSRDIYIAPSALDDIIFYCIQNYDADIIVEKIDEFIIKSGLNRNSIVIVPLHSFGFSFLGTKHLLRNYSNVFFEHENFRIYPQTNSYRETIKIIKQYMQDIRLPNRKKLNASLFDHYYKSRNLKWLERNPFLIIHFKFSQQEKFDNVRIILEKIEFITNKLYFIYALSNFYSSNDKGSLFSTKNTNNWETLDINHFITVSTKTRRADINCLPVYFSNLWVFDIIHMNIELNYKLQKRRKWFVEAINSIDTIYSGYLLYNLNKESQHLKYYRIANSLKYFRRSIKSLADEDRIINLNTAYEILLIDNFDTSKRKKMLERLWMVLRRKRQEKKKDIEKKLGELIDERNNIIHSGVPEGIEIDYKYLNSLYCRLILNIVNDIKIIDSCQSGYLGKYYDNLR